MPRAAADGVWHVNNVSRVHGERRWHRSRERGRCFLALTTAIAVGAETSMMTNGRAVCDPRGNCATAGPIGGNKVDRKAPVIS
jgi:hypothetical protein